MNSVRIALLVLIYCCWHSLALASFGFADLPSCERLERDDPSPVEIGVVQPGADAQSLAYLLMRVRARQEISLCAESWQEVLPRWQPVARQIEKGVGWIAYLAAFLLVLTAAHYSLPRKRWARLTLVGVLAFAGAVWLLAAGALALFGSVGGQSLVYHTILSVRTVPGHGLAPRRMTWHEVRGARELQHLLADLGYPVSGSAVAGDVAGVAIAPPVPTDSLAALAAMRESAPKAGTHFLTSQRVNFRTAPSTAASRPLVLPRFSQVTATGKTEGDWWQVQLADGTSGWMSSLWLRRPEELKTSPGKG